MKSQDEINSIQELRDKKYLTYLKITYLDSFLLLKHNRYFIINFILGILAHYYHIIFYSFMLLSLVDINKTIVFVL